MKQRILLLLFSAVLFASAGAQKNSKVTAYAITGSQKGQSNWSEVRLIDISTGEELKTIYQSADKPQLLNARTGKEIVKKDIASSQVKKVMVSYRATNMASGDNTNIKTNINTNVNTNVNVVVTGGDKIQTTRGNVITVISRVQTDQPFATSSAACAYDKKHERLYYTPMGINQLRYIDLKAKSPTIYYFEDEPLGALTSPGDVQNQITRMVIGADGNGYALTNNANHLIRFTTGKKMEITDLGPVSDDASNAGNSIHNSNGYGGDMVADVKGNLYLVTANRNVFRISIDNKVGNYLGAIQGMPKGYTTNGAIVEGGSSVIVSSSNSTQGYYRFDLNTLQSEKVQTSGSVYNASDLANGNLAFDKQKKEKKPRAEEKPVVQANDVQPDTKLPDPVTSSFNADVLRNQISVFPNPVTTGLVRLSFADQPPGKYQVQLMDISGKILSTREYTINNKVQVEELRLPADIAKGNYLLRISNTSTNVSISNKIVVQ